ncbi:AAA family ATPase [Hugenholtzia roseola]|uniref:AAA family ATPase n=1 Tax=Hugenholtzia roseola TaxID=1002 RepID=UPI00041050EA|nr:AAA family ATPase [Hugenholtzia roseola]
MIQKIEIKNFKSIQNISFEAKKINVLIGEPNSGKSNILEALGLFASSHVRNLKDYVRFKKAEQLFYDNEVEQDIEIRATAAQKEYKCAIRFENGIFKGQGWNQDELVFEFKLNYAGEYDRQMQNIEQHLPFRYYRFKTMENYSNEYSEYLLPPFGKNLFTLLFTNKKLRQEVSKLILEKGYHLSLNSQEREFHIIKNIDNILYTYSYDSLSDTLQRMIFYQTAIGSNHQAAILLEEPEAYMFPFYTKNLAERIAKDADNQYFIITHNPYFLNALVKYAAPQDLQLLLTSMEAYQTQVRPIAVEEVGISLDFDKDIFLNLEAFKKAPTPTTRKTKSATATKSSKK